MKKALIILMVVLLLAAMLVGCGKDKEVAKAEELIAAIGEVSLENEISINAAQGYYDTLTDKQKGQVENYSILVAANEELGNLKAEEEYKRIYANAISHEENNAIELAYEEYKKLPETYENVSERIAKLEPFIGLTGVWNLDEQTAIANDGTQMTALYSKYLLDVEINNGYVRVAFTTNALIAYRIRQEGATDLASVLYEFMENISMRWGSIDRENDIITLEDGRRFLGYAGMVAYGRFGKLGVHYYITNENKLMVTYSLKDKDDKVTNAVSFYYTKAE
ncbi:MAG: hypothetical protein FWE69_04060 [Clostridiales bacterium]|nr:hypothetical protein [Clostridiales bacterium]